MAGPRTQFVMYSGTHTIGGVVAAVSYGRDRVVFEFGAAYDPGTEYFDAAVKVRSRHWISDRLRLGLLPAIDGLYRRQDLCGYPLVPAEDSPYNTAVFITHLHLDHMAFMGMVAPQIPVYLHHDAQRIERALETVGQGVETLRRDYTDIVPDKPIKVGAITVLPLLCSDESYHDFSFCVTTPDGTIHWTGDLVLHGRQSDRVWRQIDILRKINVDVLMCDCTAFMDSVMQMMYKTMDPSVIKPSKDVPEGMLTEQQFYDGLFANIRDCQGLVVFNYYQREMGDVRQLLDWAAQVRRKCVFEPDAAYVIWKFFGTAPAVYLPDAAPYCQADRAKLGWLTELLAHAELVTAQQIAADPAGYMLQNSYPYIMELMSLPSQGGIYLHADGIPIGSFDPAYGNMVRIVKRSGFRYVTFFCENYFGHGYPCQVKYFVDAIDPQMLIPCHSYNPERLLPNHGVRLIPKLGTVYELSDHVLKEKVD